MAPDTHFANQSPELAAFWCINWMNHFSLLGIVCFPLWLAPSIQDLKPHRGECCLALMSQGAFCVQLGRRTAGRAAPSSGSWSERSQGRHLSLQEAIGKAPETRRGILEGDLGEEMTGENSLRGPHVFWYWILVFHGTEKQPQKFHLMLLSLSRYCVPMAGKTRHSTFSAVRRAGKTRASPSAVHLMFRGTTTTAKRIRLWNLEKTPAMAFIFPFTRGNYGLPRRSCLRDLCVT